MPVENLDTSNNCLLLYITPWYACNRQCTCLPCYSGHNNRSCRLPRCAPCHPFEPELAALEPLYPQVVFSKVDVEDAVGLADSFNISTLPTVALVREGREVHRLEGVPPKRPGRPVSQAIRKHLLQQNSSTDS